MSDKDLVVSLFTDSKAAGEAVATLKDKGYTDDISVVAKDPKDAEVTGHQIKQDPTDGAAAGAVTGAALGALGGLLAIGSNIVLPGIGTFVIAGPLTAALTGAAAGAATGGLIGALVDLGIPDQEAKEYEDALRRGDVIVAVSTDDDRVGDVESILNANGSQSVHVYHNH